ncbi:SIMPL domain-containing protein [Chloroflexota bacterium]
MKRNLLPYIAVSLMLAAIVTGAVGCESLSPPSITGSSPDSSSILSQQNTGIWVRGEGKVSVVPDVAILSLGVESQAATVIEAQSQAAIAMDAVVRELDGHGVDQKDIQTQRFSIYPVRRWAPEKEEDILTGYRVNNTVTAKIRQVDDAGVIIDAVTRAGGDNIRINSISFTVDDPSVANEQAREMAMADAEAKAKQLATLSGVKLGSPTYINESGGYTPAPRIIMEAAPISAPAPPPTSISPGETEISLSVQVVYSIK